MTTLFVDSLAHLLVDGLCAATLFGPVASAGDPGLLILLYNTLAFSTQGIVGLITDCLKRHGPVTAVGCIAIILGYVLPLNSWLRVCFVGLGNSLFHVGGGTRTLIISEGKAWPLGVFVAPGCIGLALGTIFPQLGSAFALMLLVCAVGIWFTGKNLRIPSEKEKAGNISLLIPVVLLVAVAVRSFGSTAVNFQWKDTAALTLLMTGFIFAGKALGGFICDRLGAGKTAWFTVLPAAVCIAFFCRFMPTSLVGQLLLNMTMPITLYLLYKAIPSSPGFAFGLAASALWPGALAAGFASGKLPGIVVFLCFAVGLAAIIFAEKKTKESNDEKTA